MNQLSLLIVPVKKIHCDKPRSDFSETTLEAAAQLILAGGGIITPLILRRENIDTFELVSGYFEYYAAVKASELDVARGQIINAYVIETNNQSVMEAQVKMFRDFQMNSTSVSTISTTDATPIPEEIHSNLDQSSTQDELTQRVAKLEQLPMTLQPLLASMNQRLDELSQGIIKLAPISQQLDELTQRLAKLEGEGLTGKTITAPLPLRSPATDSPLLIALNQLSDIELQKHCKNAGINQTKIIDAILARRREQTFGSEKEFMTTKGVGKQTVKKLVDYFTQTPIQPASEISSVTQVTPPSTHASEISPPLENEQEPTTPSSELEHPPIQPTSEVSQATQVMSLSTHANEISPSLESEQKPITSPSELEPTPLETPSPGPKISPPLTPSVEEEQLLAIINNLGQKELIFQFNRAKVKEEVIKTILQQRPFTSTQAIIKLEGIGKQKWEAITKLLKNK